MLKRENRNKENLQWKGKVVFFGTNNVNKFNEVRNILAELEIAVGMLRVKAPEIQSPSLKEIARESALKAFKKCCLPVIVEDAGLFVDALNGFPGPYSAYVYKTIGNKGLLQLITEEKNRKAKFQSAIAYLDATRSSPLVFQGEISGEIIKKERSGSNRAGFGFDPIFKPSKSRKTFAEMTTKEKNCFSHRAIAVRKFAKWYKTFHLSRKDGNVF